MIDYKALIKEMMGNKRYIHSCNVADMCVTLAEIFGEDTEKAYVAGILHDIRKEADRDVLEKEIELSGYYIDPAERIAPKTWHGIASAYYAKNVLKIEDNDILNAIRFHTVARPHMSRLEKIVYLSDVVSIERDYGDVEQYRAYAKENLDNAMYRVLRWHIPEMIKNGNKIPVSTTEAYNYYIDFKMKGKEND